MIKGILQTSFIAKDTLERFANLGIDVKKGTKVIIRHQQNVRTGDYSLLNHLGMLITHITADEVKVLAGEKIYNRIVQKEM